MRISGRNAPMSAGFAALLAGYMVSKSAFILSFPKKTSMLEALGNWHVPCCWKMVGEEKVPPCGRSIGMVEEIRRGWGYDGSGRWHRGIAEVVPIRNEAETDEDDALAPARGVMCGFFFSAVLWLPVAAAVFLSWRYRQ